MNRIKVSSAEIIALLQVDPEKAIDIILDNEAVCFKEVCKIKRAMVRKSFVNLALFVGFIYCLGANKFNPTPKKKVPVIHADDGSEYEVR